MATVSLSAQASPPVPDETVVSSSSEEPEALAGAPLAYWFSQPVGPGETVVVRGDRLGAQATANVARLDDLDPVGPLNGTSCHSGWLVQKPLQATLGSIKFSLPAGRPGVFATRLQAQGLLGPTLLVNGPQVWFFQGDQGTTASPGGQLSLYGTCLGVPGGPSTYPPRIALVQGSTVVAVAVASAASGVEASFRQVFPLPKDLAPGSYALYVHNGHGGAAAWARFSAFAAGPSATSPFRQVDTVTIAAPRPWPTTTYTVGPPAGSGRPDDAAFTAAFQFATSHGGAILQLASGTYTLSTTYAQGFGYTIPQLVTLRGVGKDGSNASVLSFPVAVKPDSPATKTVLLGGAGTWVPYPPGTGTGSQYARSTFRVENLAISAPMLDAGVVIYLRSTRVGDADRVSGVDRVRISTKYQAPGPVGIILDDCPNGRITNCDLATGQPVFVNNHTFGAVVRNNLMTWYGGGLELGNGVAACVVEGNRLHLPALPLPAGAVGLSFVSVCRDAYVARNTLMTDNPQSFWGLTFDGNRGIYFDYAASASGTSLTLAKPVQNFSYMPNPAGDSVMILAGRGQGQARMVVANPSPTTLILDRAWDVAPDTSSVITVCKTLGRMLFVNNDLGVGDTNNAFFPSGDLVFANNRLSSPSNYLVVQTGDIGLMDMLPGWRSQFLGNQITTGTGKLSIQFSGRRFQPGDIHAWYTGGVNDCAVMRNNRFASGVTGTLQFGGRVADALMENNVAPAFSLLGDTVKDTLLKGNRTAENLAPKIINQSKDAIILP